MYYLKKWLHKDFGYDNIKILIDTVEFIKHIFIMIMRMVC